MLKLWTPENTFSWYCIFLAQINYNIIFGKIKIIFRNLKNWNFRFQTRSEWLAAPDHLWGSHGTDLAVICGLWVLIWRFLKCCFCIPSPQKQQKARFWNSWIWVSELLSKHPDWSVCVLGVLRSRPPLRSRLKSEIPIFHFSDFFLLKISDNYNAVSWKCVFRYSKW